MAGSHADKELAKLREAIASPVAAVATAVGNASRAQAQFKATDDLLDGMADAAHLILALEHLAETAKAAEKAARVALATMMTDNHSPSIDSGSHTVSVSNGRNSVEIVDASAVPAELLTTPAPAPDKKKIAKFLKGKTVNWARVVQGSPVLTIRNNEGQ